MATVVNVDTKEVYEFSEFVRAYEKYVEILNEGKVNKLELYKDGKLFVDYDSRRYV